MGVRAVRIDTVSELVSAFCRDYDRRKEAIRQERCSRRVLTELKFINYKILEAAREIAGDDAEIYIREIGNKKGFASSEAEWIGESTYKLMKAEVTQNIAKKLHLTD